LCWPNDDFIRKKCHSWDDWSNIMGTWDIIWDIHNQQCGNGSKLETLPKWMIECSRWRKNPCLTLRVASIYFWTLKLGVM
jgi:hypothetical protein